MTLDGTATHAVTVAQATVQKRYRSDDHANRDREIAALTVLSEHAPGLAPRMLSSSEGELLMTRRPGSPLGSVPYTPAQTASLGVALRRLWSVPRAASGGLRERHLGPSTLAAVVAARLAAVDRSALADPVGRAVEVAAAVAAMGVPPSPLDVLGIADLNPSNVVWDGTRCRLVDFEDAGRSDVGFELADHVSHIAVRRPGRGPLLTAEALFDAVGATTAERERCRTVEPLFAAFWLERSLPGRPGHDRNPPSTLEAQAGIVLDLV